MEMKSSFSFKGKYRISAYKNGLLLRMTDWITNTVVMNNLNGLNIVLRRLAGESSIDLEIASASIGTGTTATTVNDTAMETAVVSNIAPARLQYSTSTVVAEFYITNTELADGTYSEFGVFINPGNEKMFAHSLITPNHTKSTGEDTLIEYTIEATSI